VSQNLVPKGFTPPPSSPPCRDPADKDSSPSKPLRAGSQIGNCGGTSRLLGKVGIVPKRRDVKAVHALGRDGVHMRLQCRRRRGLRFSVTRLDVDDRVTAVG